MAATLFQNGCHVRSDVASSSHAVQAVRFPFPANGEVTSHPVKARNAERPPHLALPRAWTIAVASRYRNVGLVLVPNANQRHSQPIVCAILMPMTTTSMSTVLRIFLFIPCSAPSVAYTNILVSASSCVQLISPARSQGADDNTSSSRVTITCPGHSSSTIRSMMRWKRSDLFSSVRRNSCLLLGTRVFPSTCLLIHLPLFVRVAAFRLSFQYASNTISTRCMSPRNCLRTYSLTCVTYQSNESGVRGFIMLTTAAPSRITMWASCALTVSWCVTSSETHNKRSGFVPDLKATWLDREGGYDWFSCEKNQPCQCVELDRQFTGWKTRFGHF